MALGYRFSAWLTVVACSSLFALATAAATAADSEIGGIVVSMAVRELSTTHSSAATRDEVMGNQVL